jgi:hypothetical protein
MCCPSAQERGVDYAFPRQCSQGTTRARELRWMIYVLPSISVMFLLTATVCYHERLDLSHDVNSESHRVICEQRKIAKDSRRIPLNYYF